MLNDKVGRQRGYRRKDDRVAAVINLDVNGFPVRMTADGLLALARLYSKRPDTCVAFNIATGTGHYMAKNAKKLARLTWVSRSKIERCLAGEQSDTTYAYVRVSSIWEVLNNLLNSPVLEEAYDTAKRQEMIARAGDVAYISAWYNLLNGRGYGYYSDPNIMKYRVTNAYTKMTKQTVSKPKKRVLK